MTVKAIPYSLSLLPEQEGKGISRDLFINSSHEQPWELFSTPEEAVDQPLCDAQASTSPQQATDNEASLQCKN